MLRSIIKLKISEDFKVHQEAHHPQINHQVEDISEDPQSYKEAIDSPYREQAMREELRALPSNHT